MKNKIKTNLKSGDNVALLVRVWSDNFDGDLLTLEAYNELRLQMSTGDFCTHQTELVNYSIDEFADPLNVIDLQELTEEF